MAVTETIPPALLADLARLADQADAEPEWPAASWEVLRQAGALRWSIPTAYGGDGLAGVELLRRYQALGSACLTTALILSQREAACRRVLDSGNDALCRELLPPLAGGERFATVGLSQLTTARQHLQPTFSARLEGESLLLGGVIPWVTGASRAEHLLVGATTAEGKQVLMILPADTEGVHVGPPLDLMALKGSVTAEVYCQNVRLSRRWLLAGPVERVLQTGRGGTGGLETSTLALGLAGAALAYLLEEAAARPGLLPGAERLRRGLERAQRELEKLAEHGGTPEAVAALRGRANTLVLQTTQAALTAGKGTGFVRPHPAQRWARQALFFLVWSCPWPAAAATLAYLTGEGEEGQCS
jgi:alkylation response protein AidB-like acyl-CoA dehydrogenase